MILIVLISFGMFSSLAHADGFGPHCHGAVGVQCGGVYPSSCHYSFNQGFICLVNYGSWVHDECCRINNGNGFMCSLNPVDSNNCKTQWNIAVDRTSNGYSWWRSVNPRTHDVTPTRIDRGLYCAFGGSRIKASDPAHLVCCSGRSRLSFWWEGELSSDARRCL